MTTTSQAAALSECRCLMPVTAFLRTGHSLDAGIRVSPSAAPRRAGIYTSTSAAMQSDWLHAIVNRFVAESRCGDDAARARRERIPAQVLRAGISGASAAQRDHRARTSTSNDGLGSRDGQRAPTRGGNAKIRQSPSVSGPYRQSGPREKEAHGQL